MRCGIITEHAHAPHAARTRPTAATFARKHLRAGVHACGGACARAGGRAGARVRARSMLLQCDASTRPRVPLQRARDPSARARVRE
eukprot:6196947-Pleurochrysis_carterae.AAC.2